MGKHDVGSRKHRGIVNGLILSSELGYDIDDVMGGMIFDDSGNLLNPPPKRIDIYAVTETDLQDMRRKIGEYI